MKETKIKIHTPFDKLTYTQTLNVVDFLYAYLQEYGDEKKDIKKAIDYAMKEIPSVGGYVITYSQADKIIGTVVVNKTGMGGYIPENILVYIAIHQDFRGKGVGKKLMQDALKMADGDVALHVEPDNPAKFLYEKLGLKINISKCDTKNNMFIIERNDGESIDRMLKRYKNKHRKVKLRDELKRRKEFIKLSIKRRMEILNAKYKLQKYSTE